MLCELRSDLAATFVPPLQSIVVSFGRYLTAIFKKLITDLLCFGVSVWSFFEPATFEMAFI
jgi:Glutamine amidotransferases class-II